MAYKVDVRIVKTKERLKRALLDILKEKRLDSITISEICSKSSVNRNTFYSHYQSVKDLLDETDAQFLEMILSKIHVDSESMRNASETIEKVLECVKENAEVSELLFSENGNKNFMRNLFGFVLPSAIENWSKDFNIEEEKAKKLYYFIIGGVVYVIEQWVKEGFQDSPKDLAYTLNRLIQYGQNAFIG